MLVLTIAILTLCSWPVFAQAEDRGFRLAAPEALVETGLLKFLLPRFSLKTGVRIAVVGAGAEADASLNADGRGRRVFRGPSHVWHFDDAGGPAREFTARFGDWLASEVGRDTIESFEVDGAVPFTASALAAVDDEEVRFEGDSVAGERLALLHCGRCHVVNRKNRMKAIGSTPSFGVLRGFPDWHDRFEAFYALNPHPSFTQIAGVTEPFSKERPPPIVPMALTQEDIEAILAFVTTISPADLGAPIKHQ